MAGANEDLAIAIRAVNDASKTLQQVAGDVKAIGAATQEADKQSQGLGGTLGGIAGMAGKMALGAGLAVGGLSAIVGKVGFDFNNLRQQSELAFGTMLGSGEAAKVFLDDLQDFAAKTPFDFPGLISASQRMIGMGFAADRIKPILTSVGDAVAAMGMGSEGVERVTYAMGQMQVRGKATLGDLMQIANTGLPVFQMLAEKIGVTQTEVMEMISKGNISADQAMAALEEGMTKRYGGMMEKQSHTFGGLMSTVKDTFAQLAGVISMPFFEMATKGLQKLVDVTGDPRFVGAIQGAADAMAEWVQKIADFVGPYLPPLIDGLKQLAGSGDEIVAGIRSVNEEFQGLSALLNEYVVPYLTIIADEAMKVAAAFLEHVGPSVQFVLDYLSEHKIILAAFALAIGVVAVAIGVFAVAMGIATIATTAFGVAAAVVTSPLLLIVVALTAIALAVLLAIKHWDEITAAWDRFLQKFPTVREALDQVTSKFQEFIAFVKDPVIPTIIAIAAAVGKMGADAVAFVQKHWGTISEMFDLYINIMVDIVDFLVRTVSANIEFLFKLIVDIVQLGMAIVTGDWDRAWEEVKSIFSRFIDWFGTQVDNWLRFIGDVGPKLLELGGIIMGAFWEGMKSVAAGILSWVSGLPGDIINSIPNPASALFNMGKDLIKGLVDGMTSVSIPNPLSMVPGAGALGKVGGIFKAYGGAVDRGMPYVVGDAGPEIFVPSGPGYIMPNNRVGGGSFSANISVVINGNADPNQTRQALWQALDEWVEQQFGTGAMQYGQRPA